MYLGVDQYPPFNGAPDDSYPVRVHIAAPLASYSRLKVFFRGLYAILALVIRYAMSIVISHRRALSWFAIVFTGRQPESLQNALSFALSYTTRADGLIFLITETYPALGDAAAPAGPAAPPFSRRRAATSEQRVRRCELGLRGDDLDRGRRTPSGAHGRRRAPGRAG